MQTTTIKRTFDDRPAVREATPLLLGLIGPSGTGKTYSALRLATGIQRVVGGEIFFIDTESRRALHYADTFRFRHVPFGAPFSPLDYLAAIDHCVGKGAKTIIVDSMSHEHEGPGGVLEMHEAIVRRMSGGDASKAERVKMLAWAEPKAQRRRLINSILQMPVNVIFCFRAKEKLKIERGKEPTPLGFMPIAGEEFVYEMTAKLLLLPGAEGVPTLASEHVGERAMIKIPGQFRDTFRDPRQLSEQIGQTLAEWAAGAAAPKPIGVAELLDAYKACSDAATLRTLDDRARANWSAFTGRGERTAVKAAMESARIRIETAVAAASGDDEDPPAPAIPAEPPSDPRPATDDREPGSDG